MKNRREQQNRFLQPIQDSNRQGDKNPNRSDRPQSLYYSNDHVSSDRGYHHDQDTYYGSREREDVEDRYISRPLRDHRGGMESTIRYVPGPGREYSDDVWYSYR